MQQQLLERRQIVDLEHLFTQSIPFTEFVEKTAPKTTNTILPQLAQSLVQKLSLNSSADENGNFAVIRGGSMRSYLLDNYVTDERFAELFGGIEPQLLGENPLAKQVVDKVFSLPKDIDIFFRVTTPHVQFHQNNILFSTIIEHLEQSGFTGLSRNGNENEVALFDGKYQIRLLRHQTGINHPQTLVKVDISEGNQVVLKLHFGLIPNEVEKLEDPRFYEEAADVDQEAVGYLTNSGNEEILMRYFSLGNRSYVSSYLQEHFFDPLLHPLRIDQTKKPDQIISARLREINFRVALISWLFRIKGIIGIDADLQQTPYYKLFIKYCVPFERTPLGENERLEMNQWFKDNQKNLRDHFKLIASDAIYGLSVNPFLFFLFAFSTHILDAFPLGNRLDFHSLRHFLQSLAVEIGGDLTDSLLTLSMKYNQYLEITKAPGTAIFQRLKYMEKPQTISAFLELITI